MYFISIWFDHVISSINVCPVARMMLKLKGKANDNALIKMIERYYWINSPRDVSIILTHSASISLFHSQLVFVYFH